LTALLWRYKYRLKRPGQPDDGTKKTASFGDYSAGPVDPADLTKADFDSARRRLASALPLAAIPLPKAGKPSAARTPPGRPKGG
jgi:hypothetical protein